MNASCKTASKTTGLPRVGEAGRFRFRASATLLAGGFLLASVAGAGGESPPLRTLPYHNGSTLICPDCHGSSTSAAADAAPTSATRENQEASASQDRPRVARPFLKTGEINQLCLSCHDGIRGIPDVMGADVNHLVERSAGEFQVDGEENPRGHDLDDRFTCIACHDPHGNGEPRNLRLPSDPETRTHLGLFQRPDANGLQRYERANVAYGTLDSPQLREMSGLCLDCHTSYRASSRPQTGENGAHLVHPSYDSDGGATNRIADGASGNVTDATYWNAGMGTEFRLLGRLPFVASGASDYAAASSIDAGRNGVFCLTCHKAHGSEHLFAMRWNHQAGAERASGCSQCHAAGRARSDADLTQASDGAH